jgi:Flp pilus assembly protein TadD
MSPNSNRRLMMAATLALTIAAIVYSLLAGLHTVADFDMGWQLASGRFVLLHHRIPSTDVFSYTAAGKPWIYPPFGQVLLYLAYWIGGYAALSWFCALATAVTIAVCLRQTGWITAAVAVLAAPLLAEWAAPRAELFTPILFAAFLSTLWLYSHGKTVRLWILPILMLLWVNLHPGFLAGLALLMAYVALEMLELPFAARRPAASQRLRKAGPWLAASLLATLVNPWGPGLYASVFRQERAMSLHTAFVNEWQSFRLNSASLRQAFAIRNPESAFLWLLAIAAVAAVVAILRRQLGAALILLLAGYASLLHIRLQSLFAVTTVIVAGAVLSEAFGSRAPELAEERFETPQPAIPGAAIEDAAGTREPAVPAYRRVAAPVAVAVLLVVLAGVRISDLVSNRTYVEGSSLTSFGAGESWWFPERAAAFILREAPPGELFHQYRLGGFVAWRLFPHYRDYIDGRALPFGEPLFLHESQLASASPDSAGWRSEADSRGINLVLLTIARFTGLNEVPLAQWCGSPGWTPIYLDETAIVLLRNSPANAPWLSRLHLDCTHAAFTPPAGASSVNRFEFYSNAAAVLYVLGRDREALADLDSAQRIFPFDAGVHLTRAQILEADGQLSAAETEYRAALARKQSDAAWYGLGRLLASEKRFAEAAAAITNSIEYSDRPYSRYLALAQVFLFAKQPQQSLSALARAADLSPYRAVTGAAAGEFNAEIADLTARAEILLGNLPLAIASEEKATKLAPGDARRWMVLSQLYAAGGQSQRADQARLQAVRLSTAAHAAPAQTTH